MAFDFFGALGALGRLLPGYMQGERQAVQDNWQDLSNYNQTLAGQIQNAFSQATFEPAVSMFNLAERQRQMQDILGQQQVELGQTMHPWNMFAAEQFAGPGAALGAAGQLQALIAYYQQLQRQMAAGGQMPQQPGAALPTVTQQ